MDDSNQNVWAILFGAVAYLVIMYYLIAGAVKSGTQQQVMLLKMQNRMLMRMLIKEGFTAEQIKELHDDPHEDFYWNKLKNEKSGPVTNT